MRRLTKTAAMIAVVASLIVIGMLHLSAAGTTSGGCMNQWLFNGVWRVQVTKVEPYMNNGQQVGWQVTEVWRNGTSQQIAPSNSFPEPQKLELSSGSILANDSSAGSASMNDINSHSFPASGEYTYVQKFAANNVDSQNKPKAIDITFNGAQVSQSRFWPHFSTPQYNFHFKLDCQASGTAAQAQGGSGQVTDTQGCMNQSMSNGVWQVKTTAISPDMGNDGTAQIGWMITEEWTSLVNRPIAPGNTNVTDQQLVFASGNTAASSDSVGTLASMGLLTNRTFPPGSSFTYQQRFRPGSFNASDKPVRLLVTFNATAQSHYPNGPYYKNPANFRISLECSK